MNMLTMMTMMTTMVMTTMMRTLTSASPNLQTYYMTELCGETLALDQEPSRSLSLQLTSSRAYDANLNCYVTVRAGAGSRVMTSFVWVDVNSFRHCPGDFLTLLDCPLAAGGQSAKCMTSQRICGQQTPDVTHVSANDSVTLRFVSDGKFFGRGFHIVLTQFHEGPCRNNHTDSETRDFLCNNGRCIHPDLPCQNWYQDDSNDYDHCGDRSSQCRLPVMVIVCIALAVVVVIVITFVVTVVVWYRLRRAKEGEDEDLEEEEEEERGGGSLEGAEFGGTENEGQTIALEA